MVQNDSLYFDGIIVGRAQAGWKGFNGTRRQLVEPIRAGAAKYLTGATIDTLFLQFDRKARIAWIHTMRVPMDTNNVVLVDRLDTRGGAPHVAGMLKIASPVPINGHCGDADFFQTLSETMSRVLRGIPAIAAFIGVPLPDEP